MDNNSVFFNEARRIRSGWRFLIFLLSYFLLSAVFGVGAIAVVSNLPIGFSPNSLLAFVLPFVVFGAIAVFLGWFLGKVLEDLPFRALGCSLTKNWLKDLFLGLIIGAVSFGFAALVAAVFGGLRFEINANSGASAIFLTLSVTFLIFTFGAISEEVLFRGYLLQTMSRSRLFWFGVLVTSVLFASGHANNPNATFFSWTNTFLAGIWLAAAYWKTRTLWFPFGVHLAWNWIQGAFLGISVSGLSDLAAAPIFKPLNTAETFFTGGDYGIEGGFACTLALIVSTILIYFLPFLRPTPEMLELTSRENPKLILSRSSGTRVAESRDE
jgi:membrane protease YdiL (CAAX protease family)